MKKYISLFLYYTGITQFLFSCHLQRNTIRVVNYHCTPECDLYNFEKQILFYKKYFVVLDLDKFRLFFKSKMLKPGLIITFDDGLRSNFDYATKILNKHKITGWFFVPSDFVKLNSINFTKDHDIITRQVYSDERYGMNSDELRILSKHHVIGSHTKSHYRFKSDDSYDILKNEILTSKVELENIIDNKKIDSFCWVGGELDHYTFNAYEMIKKAGYKYGFTTNNFRLKRNSDLYNINRTNIESNYSFHLLLFQLSGLMDISYFFKRKKVKNIFYKKFI